MILMFGDDALPPLNYVSEPAMNGYGLRIQPSPREPDSDSAPVKKIPAADNELFA
jgi:hypothetical protein